MVIGATPEQVRKTEKPKSEPKKKTVAAQAPALEKEPVEDKIEKPDEPVTAEPQEKPDEQPAQEQAPPVPETPAPTPAATPAPAPAPVPAKAPADPKAANGLFKKPE